MKDWEALAEWFHENREANQTDYYLIQHPALLELIGEVSGLRVLDLGCGPGSLAIALSELGAEVTAIDSSPTMLNIARKDAERNGQRVRFIQGEVKEWEEPEANYDLVTAINLLRYLERPSRLIPVVKRALASRGRFIISDVHPILNAGGRPGDLTERRVCEYFDRRESSMVFRDNGRKRQVRFYRRPLSDIFSLLTENGMVVTKFSEPQPKESLVAEGNQKYYEAGNRFPFCYLIEAMKWEGNNS